MSTIPVARIWEDADGVSHFADDFVALDAAGDIGSLSRRFAASGLVFRQTPGTYNFDWHCAPRRQFICNLDADVEVGNASVYCSCILRALCRASIRTHSCCTH